MVVIKDSNSWMKIDNAKCIDSGARGFITWQRKGNGKRKRALYGEVKQIGITMKFLLLACKHNEHVAHKKIVDMKVNIVSIV